MKHSVALNRRQFFKAGILASATAALPGTVRAAVTKPERQATGALKLGVTSYTLRNFNLGEAIAMTKRAGVKYIALKEMHLRLKSTTAERQEARRKIEAAGLTLLGGGVIYMKNDEAAIRNAFEYARDAGMPTIVCSPDLDALDTVEKLAREYRIRIAIHNHGPGDKKYPSPLDVLRLTQDRDELMGICMDVGHTVRIGEDPVEVIGKCASRLYDFHIKDVTEAAPRGRGTPVGRGVIDIVAVVKALVALKFPYHVALEYEEMADDPMPGVCESFGYARGVLAAM